MRFFTAETSHKTQPMKTGLMAHSDPNSFGGLFRRGDRSAYHRIRRPVVAEHAAELERATGWQRRWVKWKINRLADMRYRKILFSGGFSRVVRT